MKYTGLFSSEEVFNWLKKYFKFRKSASKPVTDLDALELRMYK